MNSGIYPQQSSSGKYILKNMYKYLNDNIAGIINKHIMYCM